MARVELGGADALHAAAKAARTAQRTGYAVSHDEVIEGVSSVAVPVRIPGQLPAAVALVYIRSQHTPAELGAQLADCARTIEQQLR